VNQNASPKSASRNHPEKPWNTLPELPPTAEIESAEVLKACISARAELARVNALVEVLPNKDILLHAIPLQEARSSSEIENIVTTSDALYQALASGEATTDANAKEVLRYREALWQGVDAMADGAGLDVALFERICSRIRDTEVRVRHKQVWIRDVIDRRIPSTPPAADHLGRLLANLERIIPAHRTHIAPATKLALTHSPKSEKHR